MQERRRVVRMRPFNGRDPHAERRRALAALTPYLALVRAPVYPTEPVETHEVLVATYNLHRWTPPGRRSPESPRRC